MIQGNEQDLSTILELLYRNEFRRVLATLIRLIGDFDQAEEALHDAFQTAAGAMAAARRAG